MQHGNVLGLKIQIKFPKTCFRHQDGKKYDPPEITNIHEPGL